MDDIASRPRCPARGAALDQQRGAFAALFALLLVGLLGFIGLALDLGQLYQRKAQLQTLADATALAAARQLDGTAAGLARALQQAAAVAAAYTAQYNDQALGWQDQALQFGAAPGAADGAGWLTASAAQSAPQTLLYVKVDTSLLASSPGLVETVFMRVLSDALATVGTRGRAVAGRATLNVTPLAVCALSATPAAKRDNNGASANMELVEYGFRRGVSYDLMQLNPGGPAAENFVVDPLDPVGALGSSANMTTAALAPYVCAGAVALPHLVGMNVTVQRAIPLSGLALPLNSRFDQFAGSPCTPNGAPPDTNVMAYPYAGGIGWMNKLPAGTAPATQGAATLSSATVRWTIADPPPPLTGNAAPAYGPLWAYARAVPYSAYTAAGGIEPAAGYTALPTSSWPILYPPVPAPTNYPVKPPYLGSGTYTLAPSAANLPGMKLRRVLNLPLLACPVAGGTTVLANVRAIGKFFMTVPAGTSSLYAEFAGIAPESTLGGQVELYQ